MARPADWQPLADSDPVPGDPAGVSAEAAHLASVADQIEGQVATLHKIAAGSSDEQGRHAEKLASAASETAGHLAKVVGRYRQTSSALSAWVPELEYAQGQSLKALAAAQDAVNRQRSYQPVQRPPGTHVSAQQQQQDQARASALDQASSDLAAARGMLDDAVSHWHQKGTGTAAKINSASDDGVHDGFLDHVSHIVHEYGGVLKDIATVLEFVATALAIAALFVTGLGWFIAAALVGALLLHALLAANGAGSWSDVALDVVSLATLGLAGGAAALLGKLGEGTAETAEQMLQGERSLQELTGASKLADSPEGADLLNDTTSARPVENALSGVKPGLMQRFLAGDVDAATDTAKVSYCTKAFSDSPVMQGIARQAAVFRGVAQSSHLAGLAPDWGDKIAGGVQWYGLSPEHPVWQKGIPHLAGAYNDWKESWFPEGSVWAAR